MNDNTANNTANNKANKEQGKTYYKIVKVTPKKYWLDKKEDLEGTLNFDDLKEYITNSDDILDKYGKYDTISSELQSKKDELKSATDNLKNALDEIENLKKDLKKLEEEKKALENKEITFEDLSDKYKEKFIEILKYSDYKYDVNEGLNDIYFLDTNNILNEQLCSAKGLINNENKYDYKYHYRLVDNNNRKYDFDNIDKDKELNNLMNTRLVIEATPNLVN